MPINIEKLARIEEQFTSANEALAALHARYRGRVQSAEEARRAAVFRAPDYATYSLAQLNELSSESLEAAGVLAADLQTANRHAAAASELKGKHDRMRVDLNQLGSLLPRLQRYANPGLSRTE